MKWSLIRDRKFYLILFWLFFTAVFALWWMQVGMTHVELLQGLLPDQKAHWESQKRMFFWEGIAWMGLLLVGGLTSLYLLSKEKSHLESLKTFFASFNHDVKTSLTSLRLQAEALKEDLEGQESANRLLGRLISDTMRLQIQLENSLFMSASEAQNLLVEKKSLKRFLESAKMKWPQIEVKWDADAEIYVDERGFSIVVNNLIQNALNHGQANEIQFKVSSPAEGKVLISFKDNGVGFKGTAQHLGSLFFRPTSKSGTGMGLFISKELIEKMGGSFELGHDLTKGFCGTLLLKGDLV
ncbi:MAG: HAMP domain-containing histidine kinase [Bdellovibrionales bacterium]|nr:HAMP domain-containing histidine kinase [Bdellovibrionales bacterium]